MKKTLQTLFTAALFFAFHEGYSQDDASVNFSTYLDSYYAYDFSQPDNNRRPYVTQYDRHNEFNVNHAWLKGSYTSSRIRVNLALHTGTYPINNYGAEPSDLLRMIYEANAGYKMTEKSWIDIGIFGGHFGYESALAIERELLSPALATEYTPYYQTGIRYTNEISEKLIFRAVVLNGWQNIAETNSSKSVGIAVDYQVNNLLWLSYGNYYGNEASNQMPYEHRFHNNFIIKLTPGDRLSFVGILDHTLQGEDIFVGNQVLFLTMISEYLLTDKVSMASRYEFVKDEGEKLIKNAMGEDSFRVHILSFAANFRPQANVSLKVEPKFYLSGMDTFGNSDKTVSDAFVLQAGFAFLIDN